MVNVTIYYIFLKITVKIVTTPLIKSHISNTMILVPTYIEIPLVASGIDQKCELVNPEKCNADTIINHSWQLLL